MSLTRNVTQQFSHIVNVVKGGPVNARLEYSAPVDSETGTIYQGSLVSLNASGNFVLGYTDGTGVKLPIPMFSKKNGADPDVVAGSNTVKSIVGGSITAYVATGAFEIETSEFVSGTYAANDALTAGTSTNLGKVTIANSLATAVTVVGVVSSGVKADQYGVSRLAFWPVFLPSFVRGGLIGPQGPAGADGVNAYLYVAYASDSSGTGFSLTPDNTLTYRAEIQTTEPIASPSAADFSGATWVKYLA